MATPRGYAPRHWPPRAAGALRRWPRRRGAPWTGTERVPCGLHTDGPQPAPLRSGRSGARRPTRRPLPPSTHRATLGVVFRISACIRRREAGQGRATPRARPDAPDRVTSVAAPGLPPWCAHLPASRARRERVRRRRGGRGRRRRRVWLRQRRARGRPPRGRRAAPPRRGARLPPSTPSSRTSTPRRRHAVGARPRGAGPRDPCPRARAPHGDTHSHRATAALNASGWRHQISKSGAG